MSVISHNMIILTYSNLMNDVVTSVKYSITV